MFSDIESGLMAYRDMVEAYLKKCHKLNKMGKKARGEDWQGSLDWGKKDWEWKNNTEHQMHGMTLALGLSENEVDDIWRGIKQTITKDS